MLLFLLSNGNVGVKANSGIGLDPDPNCEGISNPIVCRQTNAMFPVDRGDGRGSQVIKCVFDGYQSGGASGSGPVPAYCRGEFDPPPPSSNNFSNNNSGGEDSRRMQVDCSQFTSSSSCNPSLNCDWNPNAGSNCYSCRGTTCGGCSNIGVCEVGKNNGNSRNLSNIDSSDSTPPALPGLWDLTLIPFGNDTGIPTSYPTTNPVPSTGPIPIDLTSYYRVPTSNYFNSFVNNCALANNVGSDSGCSIRNPQTPPDSCIIFNRLKKCNAHLSECTFNFTTSLCEQITSKNGNPINW